VSAAPATPRTYVAVVVLMALGVLFALLGAWQLRRAEESRASLAHFVAGGDEAALEVPPPTLDERSRFRRLETHGELVGSPQFLLDNMLHEGVAGYHVLTALRVPGSRERLLVNRGWVVLGGDRSVLPDVGVSGGLRRIAGRLERLPRPGIRLGAVASEAPRGAAVVLQYPTAGDVAAILGEPVLDYQLLLDPAEPDGYVRQWHAPGLAPERHWSYAGQWLALAVGAAAAAVVILIKAWSPGRET
jgi:surfeit locus 1 family protein